MKEKTPINLLEVVCNQPTDGTVVTQAINLMEAEYQREGGNLRDKSAEELDELVSVRGQLWTASINEEVIATHTIEAVEGETDLWMYLNNGVVSPLYRNQSSGVMDMLLDTAMSEQTLSNNFFVISVVWGIFDRLGFTELTLEELEKIDPVIAGIVAKKIRPGTKVHLGIKKGNSHERKIKHGKVG
ncbi:MAG: hypothetical protein OEX81_03425 [Candidatus Pacebacteria bacterium]|nr:hypothetical protein [Candidatus Paceibacterota bacterium]